MDTKLVLYPAPEGSPVSHDFSVKVNDQPVDLYATPTRYGTSTFGYFDFSGTVDVEVAANFAPSHATSFLILPEKYGIKPKKHDNERIVFTIDRPMKLTFVLTGDYTGRVLHLFANGLEKDAPSPDDPDVIYFGPGYHDVGSDKNWRIDLQSNQTLYIAGGAYVLGLVNADKAKNIRLCGRGILAQFRHMPRTRSIITMDCEGIDISGIILNRQRDGWCGSLHRSSNIRITDYKVVSPVIWSTDGMNLVNCSDVTYDDCFFRAGDDNIAIKGTGTDNTHGDTGEDPRLALPNRNILIQNCIFWSENNNAIVLGQETKAACYENITVRDCDVLFCRDDQDIKAALAIVCLHATDYRNILFENIRVGPCGQLITVYYTEEVFRISGNQSFPGEINGVIFRNISAKGTGSKIIRIEGWNADKQVRNITLDNVTIEGEKVTADSEYLEVNEYVSGLAFG